MGNKDLITSSVPASLAWLFGGRLIESLWCAVQVELKASRGALTALSDALLSEQTLTGMQVEQIVSAHPAEARPEVSEFEHAPQNGSNGATYSQDLMRAGSAQ